jgi:NTE family protein
VHEGKWVAIACEGGGSHTAFTSGVLQRLLREPIEVVALSGTSGGAVCATLAWRGLLAGDRQDAIDRLTAFWRDNAVEGVQALWDAGLLWSARLVGELFSPEVSPYRIPWDARELLTELLERHGGFAEVPELLRGNPAAPRLLIGATDVRRGQFRVFRSHPVTHRGTTYPADEITAADWPITFVGLACSGAEIPEGLLLPKPVRECTPGEKFASPSQLSQLSEELCESVQRRAPMPAHQDNSES